MTLLPAACWPAVLLITAVYRVCYRRRGNGPCQICLLSQVAFTTFSLNDANNFLIEKEYTFLPQR